MNTKSLFKIVSVILSTTVVSPQLIAAETPTPQTVAITQIADFPASDAVREGIEAALKGDGYEDGKTIHIIYENAQENPETEAQIAKKFVDLKPDVLVPITTPSTQSIIEADKDNKIPIVFAAVTDPVASGFVPSLNHPGGHITGTTDATPIKHQIEVFKQILPQLKTLGIIYKPGDKSSSTPVKETQKVSKELGITLIEATAFKASDVPAATQQLVSKKVDAIFVPLDDTALEAMDKILKIGFQHEIPVFSSDDDSVSQGALASSGYTEFDIGYATGKIVVQVLKGANPGDIPVAQGQDLSVYLNLQSAQKLHLNLPEAIVKTAKKL